MATCLEWAEERTEVCTETRDEGYNGCAEWNEWFAWLCVVWVWVENVRCVAWTVVTTSVCVLWDTVTTVVNAILVSIESIVGWFLSSLAAVVEYFECIPGLGALVRWLLNLVTGIVWTIASFWDIVAGLAGIRPEKILRVCPVILSEKTDKPGEKKGEPVASMENMVAVLQLACNVYKRDANVRIVPSRPFHYATGFAGPETVKPDWVIVAPEVRDSEMLDPPCEGAGVLADWGVPGQWFQHAVLQKCWYGAWRRVLGYGAPVTVFAVRSVPGASGCSLIITDFVTVEVGSAPAPANPRVVGHELGHACYLGHVCVAGDIRNIMATGTECVPDSPIEPDLVDPHLAEWQVHLIRASKHVTYF
jgi:hypothetical protein